MPNLGQPQEPSALIPGSDPAVLVGCTCPEEQPGQGGEQLAIDCPIHGLLAPEQWQAEAL